MKVSFLCFPGWVLTSLRWQTKSNVPHPSASPPPTCPFCSNEHPLVLLQRQLKGGHITVLSKLIAPPATVHSESVAHKWVGVDLGKHYLAWGWISCSYFPLQGSAYPPLSQPSTARHVLGRGTVKTLLWTFRAKTDAFDKQIITTKMWLDTRMICWGTKETFIHIYETVISVFLSAQLLCFNNRGNSGSHRKILEIYSGNKCIRSEKHLIVIIVKTFITVKVFLTCHFLSIYSELCTTLL